MANEQDHPEQDSDICLSVPAENCEKKVDAQSYQKGPPGENKPSSNMEPSEQEKEGETKHMAT